MMKVRAAAARVRSLPVRAASIWETIPDVRTTVSQLTTVGMFRMAAMLADELWSDDRFAAVLGTRTDALVGSDVNIQPADDTAKARKASDALGTSDSDGAGLWDEIFPDSAIEDLVVNGNVLNMGLAKIEWELMDGLQMPRITPMHAQFVRWDMNTRSYWFLTENMGLVELPRLDENPHGDGNWLVWTPFGYDNWRKAMLRWMGPKLIMRRWNEVDWANYNEIYGRPQRLAYVPGGVKDDEGEAFFNEVDSVGANGTLKIPRSQDAAGKDTGYGYGLVEAKSRGWDTFEGFKESNDKDVAVGYLGVNLLTDAQGGSLALSQEQTPIFLNRVMKDAKLAKGGLRSQVLWHWALRNFGDGRLAPRVSFEVQPPESEVEEGTGYLKLGQGVKALTDGGIPVDPRAIGDAHGIPMKTPEQEAADKAQAVQDAQDAMATKGGPPGGGPASPGDDKKKQPPPFPSKTGKVAAGARYVQVPPESRYTFQGLPIAVENPKGTTRLWRDEQGGETGRTEMQADYGYIDGHMGSDGEELDCYVGGDEAAKDVHIVHQLAAPDYKAHDEDKVMLGYPDPGAAKAAFLAHRNDGDRAFEGMSTIPLGRFKAKLQRRTSTGKIRAEAAAPTAADDEKEALALLERAEHMVLAAHGGHAKRRARTYADKLADNAIAAGARGIGPDIARVKAIVAGADGDLKSLRPRLAAAFKAMDPAKLTELVFRANMMARLGGKAAAVKRL